MEVILKKAILSVIIFTFATIAIPSFCDSVTPSPKKSIEVPSEAVSKKVLENGLVILAEEGGPKDLVAIDVKILAGSGMEGKYLGSGISHLVEHMLFKGTSKRGPGEIEKEIKSYGGQMNGSASQDMTDYNMIVPSAHLREAVALLKDMLSNAAFNSSELAKEKEVILKEMSFHNDVPQDRLIRLLNQTAYLRHPYKYETIGVADIFRALRREDLVDCYNSMYVPNNIAIAVVGGVDPKSAISIVEEEFKNFRRPNFAAVGAIPEEPLQIARRERIEEISTNLGYMAIGFHSTGVLDKDIFALDALSMILGRGDSSRLNKALVQDKEIAYSVSSWNYTPRDPGLFVIIAVADKDNLQKAEGEIENEIAKIKNQGISDEDLERAKRMVLGDYFMLRETQSALADDIAASYLLTGNPDFSQRYVAGIRDISKNDIIKVAERYLDKNSSTVVKLVPEGYSEAAVTNDAKTEDRFLSETLPNGTRLFVRENKASWTVSICAAVSGGLAAETNDNNGVSNLVSRLILCGTKSRDESHIKGAIESLGGSIDAFSGFDSLGVTIELLPPDIENAMTILKDILTDSIFPEKLVGREKEIVRGQIKLEADDIFDTGISALRKEIFDSYPYSMKITGTAGSLDFLTRESILKFYEQHFGARDTVIFVSGNIDATSVMKKLKELFGDMKKGSVTELPKRAGAPDKTKTEKLVMDKDQSLVLIGFETAGIGSDDRYALEVLGSILSGQSGRLFSVMRNKLPLAYTLGFSQKFGRAGGFAAFYVATNESGLKAARDNLFLQIKEIREKMVEESELAMAKREITTSHLVDIQHNGFVAQRSALDALYGIGHDNLWKFTKEIEKVTREDLKRAAQKYFRLDRYQEVTISPK